MRLAFFQAHGPNFPEIALRHQPEKGASQE